MHTYYFEKPFLLQQEKPLLVYDSNQTCIGKITKSATQIAFSKNQNVYTYYAYNTDKASITLEIDWLETEGATVVFHNLEDDTTIAFKEANNRNETLSVLGSWSHTQKLKINQTSPYDPIIIKLNEEPLATIIAKKDALISIEIEDTAPPLPLSFFFLVYFIQKLLQESN